MNYSAVAPPSQSGSVDPQSAFADALARARQIAAKINQPGEQETGAALSLKRPYEGGSDSQPDAKKMASLNDPMGAQMRQMNDPSRASQASAAAAAAAAQINAKLGLTGGGSPPSMMPPQMQAPMGIGGMHGGLGLVKTEDYSVPDRMVGLVIGKGGEQIAAIQAETGCKVQFAPDSGGLPDRPCTLTGPEDAIRQAREMIDGIIAKGQGMPDPGNADGVTMVEVLIPGNKVGLVIGKGGETIKGLQENAGVKMVMIQDSNQPTHYDKPLRITGEMSRCQKAKESVLELIADKDGFGGGGGGNDNYGRGGQEIPVPVSLVGVVIGKGGEMIKKIQAETGARVQFKQDDGSTPDRICSVTGSGDRVAQAAQMINELIHSAQQRQCERGGGMGRGRGRGRGDDRNGGFGDRGPGGGRFGQFGGEETTFSVPSEKCGLVIGKGGETIREINRQSNAHVELSRQPAANTRERLFKIQGSPEEIQSAIRLICEKAGLPPPGPDQGPRGNGGPGPGGPGGPPGQGPPGGYGDQYQYGQQYGQQNQPPFQHPHQPPGPGPSPPNFGGPQQGWGGNYQQWNVQQQTPPDPSKQAADPNTAAAWAAYYQQYYQGAAQGQQQQQQPAQQQQQPQAPQPHQQPQQQASVNPATGQPDYSAAWAEYYRQQGMPYHAQAILQQAAGGPQQPGAGQPPQPPQ